MRQDPAIDLQEARPPSFEPASLVAAGLAIEVAHLAWEAMHGGVATHHLLDRADLPGISNLWGLLVVPCLALWTVWRWRLRRAPVPTRAAGLLAGVAAGAGISLAFRFGSDSLTSVLFFGAGLLTLILPGYRAECLLGFVLGMCWTFGAVIPLIAGGVVVTVSALVHRVLYRGVWHLWRRLRQAAP